MKKSFIIEMDWHKLEKIMNELDRRKIPYYYLTEWGAVEVGGKYCKEVWGDGKAKYVAYAHDKHYFATADYLKKSHDGVCIDIRIPGSHNEFDEIQSIMDFLQCKEYRPDMDKLTIKDNDVISKDGKLGQAIYNHDKTKCIGYIKKGMKTYFSEPFKIK